jgi:hypothetical protein
VRLNWQSFPIDKVREASKLGPAQVGVWSQLGTIELDPYNKDTDCDPLPRDFDCGFLRLRLAIPEVFGGAGKRQLSLPNAPPLGVLSDGSVKTFNSTVGAGGPPRLQLLLRFEPGDAAPPFDYHHSLTLDREASGIVWARRVKIYALYFDDSPTLDPLSVQTSLWASFVACDPGAAGGREFVGHQSVIGQINEDLGFNPLELSPPSAVSACCVHAEWPSNTAGMVMNVELQAHAGVIISHWEQPMGGHTTGHPPIQFPWPSAAEFLRLELVGGAAANRIMNVGVDWIQGAQVWGG